MILEALKIENVGVYAGQHHFRLAPDSDKNRCVVVIQGHNGGGKSTFLEALQLVLYGRRSLGAKVSQSQYDTYLAGKIHSQSQERVARITLELSRVEEGRTCCYRIFRGWAARGTSVAESFELSRNGEPIPGLQPEDFEMYVDDLVPSAVSQLYFFDAEKLEKISNSAASGELRESIQRMLGLDLIERLKVDLTLYMARARSDRTETDLEDLQREYTDTGSALRIAEEERAEISSRRDQILQRASRAEREFRNEGGRIANGRDELQERLEENKRERERHLQTLRSAAADVLPLGIAPLAVEQLRRIAESARAELDASTIVKFIDRFEAETREACESPLLWSKDHFSALRECVRTNSDASSISLDGDLNFISRRLDRLDEARIGAKQEMHVLADALDRNVVEFSAIKEELEGFHNGLASEALEKLKTAERECGSIEVEIAQQDRAISELRKRRDALAAERQKAMQAVVRRAHEAIGRDVATRARSAIEDYSEALLDVRLEDLKRHLVDCFNQLNHKIQLIEAVNVDRETFEVTLIGGDEEVLPRESLSAGERQILAISLLWALGNASGQSLPLVIDGPFARLDSQHRRAVIENYVTASRHQVILLCTDTEMTPDLERILMPHVSGAYRLTVPKGTRATTSVSVFNLRQHGDNHAYQ